MKPINIYTSADNQGLGGLLVSMGYNLGREVLVRPLSELQGLTVSRRLKYEEERAELVEAIALAEHDLERLVYGEAPADAGRENGLRADLNALNDRLRAVNVVLGTREGGQANG